MGPSPISYIEIEAFSRLEMMSLSAGEVRLIRRLDRLAMKAAADRSPTSPEGAVAAGVRLDDDAGIAAMLKGMGVNRRMARAGR